MNVRLALLATVLLVPVAAQAADSRESRPNIILILADDK